MNMPTDFGESRTLRSECAMTNPLITKKNLHAIGAAVTEFRKPSRQYLPERDLQLAIEEQVMEKHRQRRDAAQRVHEDESPTPSGLGDGLRCCVFLHDRVLDTMDCRWEESAGAGDSDRVGRSQSLSCPFAARNRIRT
jgi:hypothetical protein